MNYRDDRKAQCLQLFADFRPDLTKCKNPEIVLKCAELASLGYFSHEIAEIVSKSPKAVQKIYRRYNFPVLQNFAPPLRENRKGWAGGLKIVKNYEYQRTIDHPNRSKHGGYVAVHRLVVEQKIGRYLLRTEVVDHIDGNTRNNHPDNLRVFANNAEHLRATLAGKCPNWTVDGKRRIREAVILSNQKRAKTLTQPIRAE